MGAAGVKNGVTINAANLGANGRGAQQEKPGNSPENNVANVSLNVDKNNSSVTRGGSIAHEIKHASDYISKGAAKTRDEALERERAAYPYNSNVYKGNDAGSYSPGDIERLSNQSADEWCKASPQETPGCN